MPILTASPLARVVRPIRSVSTVLALAAGVGCFGSSSPNGPSGQLDAGVPFDSGGNFNGYDAARTSDAGRLSQDAGAESEAADAGNAAPDSGTNTSCAAGTDSGKVYVADSGNNRIVRADDMCGTNWTSLGMYAGPGTGMFDDPEGVTVDAAGKIYVADTGNNRIVRMDDMTGTNWTTLGTLGTGANEFQAPRSVFVDAGGHIFVTDFGNQRVVRVDDMTGTNWTTVGVAGTGAEQFTGPWGLFVDGMGRIYVTDTDRSDQDVASRLVRMDDMTGANWTTFGALGAMQDQFTSPWGVFVDAMDRIYIADYANQRIVRIDDMTGTNWMTMGTLGQGPDEFLAPTGVFVDGTGRIYISDQGSQGLPNDSHVVRVAGMTGANWTSLGTLGPAVKEFTYPTAVWLH